MDAGHSAPNSGLGVELPQIIMAWISPLLGFISVFALMAWLSSRRKVMRSSSPVRVSDADWLRRDWKAVAVAIVGLFISNSVFIALGIRSSAARMRSSDAAKLTIATAQANPALTEKLGLPLKTSEIISGYTSASAGTALVIVPISGPRGSGVLYADVRKQSGVWQLRSLVFRADGSAVILDLLPVLNQKSNTSSQ
jgi:hypothetical protein